MTRRISNRFAWIIRRCESLSNYSVQTRNLTAAITIAEMHFRPAWWRFGEYAAAGVLLMTGRPVDHLSIGVCQLSLRHIKERKGCSSLEALCIAANVNTALEECAALIDCAAAVDPVSCCRHYNGTSTTYYRSLVDYWYERIRSDGSRGRLAPLTHPSSTPR